MSLHLGRSWEGHHMEDECPCPQEECGLVDTDRVDPNCDQHSMLAAKTLRQGHQSHHCPKEPQ